MNNEQSTASTPSSNATSPRRGKSSDKPSLLHASSASFPDMPRRPEDPTSPSPPSPRNSDNPNGPIGFLKRIKKGVEQGLRPLPGGLKVSKESDTPMKSTVSPAISTPNAYTDKNPSNSQFSDMIKAENQPNSSLSPRSIPSLPTTTPYRIAQFEKILSHDEIDLKALRSAAWNGVPSHHRPQVWQMLLNYMPSSKDRRETSLMKKRAEYYNSLIPLYQNVSKIVGRNEEEVDRSSAEGEILRQILVDIPRTATNIPLFSQPIIQSITERVLYIYAIRHPACGYVQGMNDLLVPMVIVLLQGYLSTLHRDHGKGESVGEDPFVCDVAQLPKVVVEQLEADCYWCFTKLLDTIQDHYIFGQPGLQRMILKLEDLVARLDPALYTHIKHANGVLFIQFAFRWMNCLLIREMPLFCIIRLYDTYFAQEYLNFVDFHVYVCCVLLTMFKEELMKMDFQELITFLQNLPTYNWTEKELESILAQAYILSNLFDNSPSHLNNAHLTGDSIM